MYDILTNILVIISLFNDKETWEQYFCMHIYIKLDVPVINMESLVIFVLGKPGCGKGTQCQKIAEVNPKRKLV